MIAQSWHATISDFIGHRI